VLYAVFLIYAVVQYGAYLMLDKFLFISDFMYAGEGIDFFSYALEYISPSLIIQVTILVVIGIAGNILLGKERKSSRWIYLVIIILCAAGINKVPELYGEKGEDTDWDEFMNPASEYGRFVNANFDLELTGMYQYLVRDSELQLEKKNKGLDQESLDSIDLYFAKKSDHEDNEMTGLFSGKNLLVFMLESTDDWLINEEDTPTIWYMMEHGIRFSNMYTPGYSNGYTFNTEFAYNTSIYPYANGNAAYMLVNNRFENSIANVFRNEGYDVNSFHEGIASFYNRGEMHISFGYSRYHSYLDYGECDVPITDDSFLVKNDSLYKKLVQGNPFYSYVITYGGHLPYNTDTDEYSGYALEAYPKYENDEVGILKAKVRLTDDMFKGILLRLESEGLLEDTVIVGFTDHYAYGLSNKEQLRRLSEDAGSSILERTPAFVYCSGHESIDVDKVMQTTDLAPTIMNLFGFDVPKEIMGHDVFDENYPGFAIFPNNTWLTNEAYMKAGVLQWNHGMTDEEIAQMNAYVQEAYVINDKILDSDYYAHMHE